MQQREYDTRVNNVDERGKRRLVDVSSCLRRHWHHQSVDKASRGLLTQTGTLSICWRQLDNWRKLLSLIMACQ